MFLRFNNSNVLSRSKSSNPLLSFARLFALSTHKMISYLAFAAVAVTANLPLLSAFNNPSGVDIWCGKAYRSTWISMISIQVRSTQLTSFRNASFEPDGWFEEPAKSSVPLLDLKIRPRMSLYLDSDHVGSLLIDASLSYLVGEPFITGNNSSAVQKKTELDIQIASENSSLPVIYKGLMDVDSVNNEISVSLDQFPPSLNPYDIVITASIPWKNQTLYSARTQLLRLPSRTDGGSITKLDNLYGGLSVLKGNETKFSLIFPYTYYGEFSDD